MSLIRKRSREPKKPNMLKNSNVKLVLIVAVIVIIVSISGIYATTVDFGSDSHQSLWGNAPNFSLKTIDGDTYKLSDQLGKVIILDFMGVDCSACQVQMIDLKEVSENYPDVEIVSIDVMTAMGENADSVKALINAFKQQGGIDLDWVFLLDTPQNIVGSKYVTTGAIPTIYIIDQKGNIYHSHASYTKYNILASELDELLS